MQITHQEARRLIQLHADNALNAKDKTGLFTHLKTCVECRTYEAEIKELADTLLPTMNRQWNLRPVPLSITDLEVKRKTQSSFNITLAIRKAIIAFVFVAFVFSAWQFTRPGQALLGLPAVIVAPVSTPSLESTNTMVSSENCEGILYGVQANDTLSGIAAQFSISKDEIIARNRLGTETIHMGMALMIPVCRFTPTSTLSPTTTTTYTPVISSATEPDGY
jgi:LysM domain/Putative zinc-finger